MLNPFKLLRRIIIMATVIMTTFTTIAGDPLTSCGVGLSSFPNMGELQDSLEVKLKEKGYTVLKPSIFQKIISVFNKKFKTKTAKVSISGLVDGKVWKTEKLYGGELWAAISVKNIKTGEVIEFEDSVMNTTDFTTVMPQIIYNLTPKLIKTIEKLSK